MSKKTILFVPGKHPKPPEQEHLALLRHSLVEGLRRVSVPAADMLEQDAELLGVASWNHSYYGEYRNGLQDWPWIHLMLERGEASEKEMAEAQHWHLRLAHLYVSVVDYFPRLIRYIPESALRQSVIETYCYFRNIDNVACRVREYVKAPLRQIWDQGGQVLLIGHSMGSVIAYDSLWELYHEEKRSECVDLLTIGSPLGMHFIQHRLQCWHCDEGMRFPGNIRHWTNISAIGDLVALDSTVADDFSDMVRQGSCTEIIDIGKNVYNYFRDEEGLNVHRSYGYLSNPEVCKTVAQWLESD
ncbi:MAG: hypothetical protein IME93_00165 [Proteobacteria bacterium]|nr:hypothetical protein [Pseudomonadota bacterium]